MPEARGTSPVKGAAHSGDAAVALALLAASVASVASVTGIVVRQDQAGILQLVAASDSSEGPGDGVAVAGDEAAEAAVGVVGADDQVVAAALVHPGEVLVVADDQVAQSGLVAAVIGGAAAALDEQVGTLEVQGVVGGVDA